MTWTSTRDLYAVNKVLGEWDFFPLAELHDIMLALKIGRHFKGEFRLMPFGKTLVAQPGRLFGVSRHSICFELITSATRG